MKHYHEGVLRFSSKRVGNIKINNIYGSDGVLLKTISYENNKKHGHSSYYVNGSLSRVDDYKNGKIVGKSEYKLAGNVLKYNSSTVVDGEIIMVYAEYDVLLEITRFQCNLKVPVTYRGDYSDVAKHYTRVSGNEKHTYTQINGKFQGEYSIHVNERKIASMNYVDNELHGRCWQIKTECLHELHYSYGTLEHCKTVRSEYIKNIRNFKNRKMCGMQEDYHDNGVIKKRWWINEHGTTTDCEEFNDVGYRIN